jgi:hypothetical protein
MVVVVVVAGNCCDRGTRACYRTTTMPMESFQLGTKEFCLRWGVSTNAMVGEQALAVHNYCAGAAASWGQTTTVDNDRSAHGAHGAAVVVILLVVPHQLQHPAATFDR